MEFLSEQTKLFEKDIGLAPEKSEGGVFKCKPCMTVSASRLEHEHHQNTEEHSYNAKLAQELWGITSQSLEGGWESLRQL